VETIRGTGSHTDDTVDALTGLLLLTRERNDRAAHRVMPDPPERIR
jgi:hypothetical protein